MGKKILAPCLDVIIIRVINKQPGSGSPTEYDYRQNWTTRSPVAKFVIF